VFDKLEGIDIADLVRTLRDHGISVISSSILFMEHHDRRTLQEDIEWAIGLGTDMHQFMQLTPLPGTPLFNRYQAEGKLLPDFPYTKMSGQSALNFHHPHFDSGEAAEITRRAFGRKYVADGPAVLNLAETAMRGYLRAVADVKARAAEGRTWDAGTLAYSRRNGHEPDAFLARRIDRMRQRLEEYRPILPAARLFAPSAEARRRCRELSAQYREHLGPAPWPDRVKATLLVLTASAEHGRLWRARRFGSGEIVRQPPTRRIEYDGPAGERRSPVETGRCAWGVLGTTGKRRCDHVR
jgi:hypothetical protein